MKNQNTNSSGRTIIVLSLFALCGFMSLIAPRKICNIPVIMEAQAVSARMVAAFELPKQISTSTTLTPERSIVIKEEVETIKIRLFETAKRPSPSTEVFDADFNKFFSQAFYNGIFSTSAHKEIFDALFASEDFSPFYFRGETKFSQVVEKTFKQNLEKQMAQEASRVPKNQLWEFSENPLNELLPTCNKYFSYGNLPLERQLGEKKFSENGRTNKRTFNRSKVLLDAVNLSIPDKYFRVKSILDCFNNSSNVGWFHTEAISKKSSSPESIVKHHKSFVLQKYYMFRQIVKGRAGRRLNHSYMQNKYPARVMNHFNFGTDSNLDIVFPPADLNQVYPHYRITDNGQWHNEDQIKSKERGSFYQFNLLPPLIGLLNQDNSWSKHLTRYCDLTVSGSRSQAINKDSVEVNVDCGQIGFDFLRKITEKTSEKFPVVKQAKPTINLITSGAEELFKFKFNFSYSHYKSLYVANPDACFSPPRTVPPLVRSVNFNFHIENRALLRIWSYVNILDHGARERPVIDGQPVVILPDAPADWKPVHSKTYQDSYIYRGTELNYISIANKLLTVQNLTVIKSALIKIRASCREIIEIIDKKLS